MQGSRPCRLASRTHDGGTFRSVAASSASSNGSSSEITSTALTGFL
jgi:hypothetical protein